MEKHTYKMEYLNGLKRIELLEIMKEHGYEEGYNDLNNSELIEQISTIVESE